MNIKWVIIYYYYSCFIASVSQIIYSITHFWNQNDDDQFTFMWIFLCAENFSKNTYMHVYKWQILWFINKLISFAVL